MTEYTKKQIQETLKIVESSITNCEKIRLKLKDGYASFSLNTNRIKALYISQALLTNQDINQDIMYTKEELGKAFIQIQSIKNKSITGIHNAKKGSSTYTKFSRLINAMDIILKYLENAIEKCK